MEEFNFTPEEVRASKTAFLHARYVYDEMISLYEAILKNTEVCSIIDKEIHMPGPAGKDADINYKVMMVMFIDLIKCFQNMGHPIDFNNKDAYLLPMAVNLILHIDMTTEIEFDYFMKLESVKYIYEGLLKSFESWAKNDGADFLFTRFAKEKSIDICNKYMFLMLTASDYIKRATPTNITQEYRWTADLRKISF